MGSTQSELCHRKGEEPVGYRVLSVHENSPASNVTVIHNGERQLMVEERITGHALVPYFDFIISINGKRLDEDNGFFIQEIKRQEGKVVELEIFNAKCGKLRVVQLVPQQYGGTGFLGLFVRFDTYLGSRDNILRVLEVKADSPSDLGGLIPLDDYVLAADDSVFECLDDFGDYLADKEGDNITLFVYNAERDSVREVSLLVSTKAWGANNETGLGLSVGTGHLHTLPNQETTGVPDFVTRATALVDTTGLSTPPRAASKEPVIMEPIGDQKSGSDIFTEVDLLTPSSPGAVQVYPPPAEPALPAWNDDEDGEDEEDSDFSTDSGQAGDDDMTSPEGVDRRVIVTEHSHSHQ